MNWAWKKNTFSRSNYNWVSRHFGDQYEDVMAGSDARGFRPKTRSSASGGRRGRHGCGGCLNQIISKPASGTAISKVGSAISVHILHIYFLDYIFCIFSPFNYIFCIFLLKYVIFSWNICLPAFVFCIFACICYCIFNYFTDLFAFFCIFFTYYFAECIEYA